MTDAPLVSVCLPVYNAEPWIASAIESALAQTHQHLELIVTDGASSDATSEIVRSYRDNRIRLEVAPRRLGAVDNYNRSVELSTGKYVKFLHADDELDPSCVEEMIALAQEDPRIGLVFSRRAIRLDEPHTPSDLAWAQQHANPHLQFDHLSRINDGRDLFRQMLDAGFEGNWIGEPSSVLVTRECLVETGLFNPRQRQLIDLELWLRVLVKWRVGFIDHILSTYFHHADSITGTNARLRGDWLDHLWLLESLLREPITPSERRSIEALRRSALRKALRTQAGRLVHRRLSTEFVDYVGYAAKSRLGRPEALHPELAGAIRVPVEQSSSVVTESPTA